MTGSVRSIWMRGGGCCALGTGTSGHCVPPRGMTNPLLTPGHQASCCTRPRCPSGRLGADAFAFVDWLAAAGQRWWQVLPLGPPDEHRSPYKARSAFAADPGLLADPDAPVVRRRAPSVPRAPRVLARGLAGLGRRPRRPGALRPRVGGAARATRPERGVRLLGDLPIYVAEGSADHAGPPRDLPQRRRGGRAARQLLRPTASTGATRSTTGRRCSAAATAGGSQRLQRNLELYDAVRVDHFRGFVAYWAIPEADTDGARRALAARARAPRRSGRCRRAVGARAAARRRGPRRHHAAGPRAARRRSGCRAWSSRSSASTPDAARPHRFENHPRRAVAYTGTHDNAPVAGWWAAAMDAERARGASARSRRAGVGEQEPALGARST